MSLRIYFHDPDMTAINKIFQSDWDLTLIWKCYFRQTIIIKGHEKLSIDILNYSTMKQRFFKLYWTSSTSLNFKKTFFIKKTSKSCKKNSTSRNRTQTSLWGRCDLVVKTFTRYFKNVFTFLHKKIHPSGIPVW